jgi:hypothetical protein
VHVLNSLILCIFIKQEGIGTRKKSKGGLGGSIPRRVAGWVCYNEPHIEGLVEEISLGFLRRHLGLQQDMPGAYEAPG